MKVSRIATVIPPGRLVALRDPDGNIVELIDNSKSAMP